MPGSNNKVFSIEEIETTPKRDYEKLEEGGEAPKEKKNFKFLSDELAARIATSGIHVLSDNGAGIVRKLLWCLLIIAAVGFTGWNLAKEISRFNQHETETSITIVEQSETIFPAVTFCPRPSIDSTSSRFDFFPYIIKFNGIEYPENKTKIVSTVHGVCLQINGLGELVANEYGTYSNLRIETEYKSYVPFHTKYVLYEVYVQSHDLPPSSYILTDYSIPVNFKKSENTEIRIQKIRWTHQNPELGNCVGKTGKYAHYSKGECWVDCLSSFIQKEHECKVTGLTASENISMPHCGSLYAYVHEKHIFENILHGYLKDSKCKDSKSCPQECDTTTFALSKYTYDHVYDGELSFVMIYYQTLDYQHIVTRKAYDGWLLLCNIGGALGLFLGATLLTVVDVVDYFACMFLSKIQNKITRA